MEGASSTTPMDKAEPILNAPLVPIQWVQTVELSYSGDAATTTGANNEASSVASVCFGCGQEPRPDAILSKCARCQIAGYCNKACQVADWKKHHKHSCASYSRAKILLQTDDETAADSVPNEQPEQQQQHTWSTTDHAPAASVVPDAIARRQDEARNEIFGRIRFYACPYAVTRFGSLGRGFLFLQSDQTLSILSLAMPKNLLGRSTGMRSLMVHYLTLGEFDQEVCRDDFEMTVVRFELQKQVTNYDEQTQVVVLMRFRCGHVALGTATLVPNYSVCQMLGREYFATEGTSEGALQLNLDDI